MANKKANKTEKKRLDRLHQMPCAACGSSPVEVHHLVNHVQRKRDHMRTIPLCGDFTQTWGCHRGPLSIHKTRKSFRAVYGHEEELLDKTNDLLGREE